MAKDLDDETYETLCARILGHEIPHGADIPAATLLEPNPRKAAPIVRLDAECGPGRPRFSCASALHAARARDTMPEKAEAGFRHCHAAHNTEGAT